MHFNIFLVKNILGKLHQKSHWPVFLCVVYYSLPKMCFFLLEKCWNACQVLLKFFLKRWPIIFLEAERIAIPAVLQTEADFAHFLYLGPARATPRQPTSSIAYST